MSHCHYVSQYQQQDWLRNHVRRLMQSYAHWLGQPLIPLQTGEDALEAIMQYPLAIASHDHAEEARFNFANQAALDLFRMTAEQMLGLASRHSAQPMLQADRAKFLQQVKRQGYVRDYAGVRIAQDGQLFEIQAATVWNVWDPEQPECGLLGQAVIIPAVRHL